jgi:hypothetical protein
LAFNDGILHNVEEEWKTIMGVENEDSSFMKFEERAGMNEDEDNDNDGY